MADMIRGERRVRLFAELISHPEKKYTISDLMGLFGIPENERRNLQRDMQYLSEMDGGRYIKVSGKSRSYVYSSALKSADRLLFPNFENTMLHLVFLQRIANIYPATSDTIHSLLTKIKSLSMTVRTRRLSSKSVIRIVLMAVVVLGSVPVYVPSLPAVLSCMPARS